MSLLYSTIRIISPASTFRKITRVIPFLFILFWATLMALKIWWCDKNTQVVPAPGNAHSMCVLPVLIVLFEVISE